MNKLGVLLACFIVIGSLFAGEIMPIKQIGITSQKVAPYTYTLLDAQNQPLLTRQMANKIDADTNTFLDCDLLTCDYKIEISALSDFNLDLNTIEGEYSGAGASIDKVFYYKEVPVELQRPIYKLQTLSYQVFNNETGKNEEKSAKFYVQTGIENYEEIQTIESTDSIDFTSGDSQTIIIRFRRADPSQKIDLYDNFMGKQYMDAAWWNATFLYKQQYNLTGWTCNYAYCQSYLNITLNPTKTNGSDMRVLNEAEDTEMAFWREDDAWNYATASGRVWLNLTNNTSMIWIYYNATNVIDKSNIDATFLFGDDFNEASINLSKWSGNTSYANVSGGKLNLTSPANPIPVNLTAQYDLPTPSEYTVVTNAMLTGYGARVGFVSVWDTNASVFLSEASGGQNLLFCLSNTDAGRIEIGQGMNSSFYNMGIRQNPLNVTCSVVNYTDINSTVAKTPTATNVGLGAYDPTGSVVLKWLGLAQMPGSVVGFTNGTPILGYNVSISFIPPTPNDNAVISGSLNVNTVRSNINLTDCTLYLNASSYAMQVNPDLTCNTTLSLSDGVYSYYAYTNNSTANATTETRTVTIDSIAPSGVAITSPANNSSLILNANINLGFNETNFGNCTLYVNGTANTMTQINATNCQYSLTNTIGNFTLIGQVCDLAGFCTNSSAYYLRLFNYSASMIFQNPEVSGFADNQQLNITTQNGILPPSAILNYNGSSITATATQTANGWIMSAVVIPPDVAVTTEVKMNWSLSFDGFSNIDNYVDYTNVTPFLASLCNGTQLPIFNFSFFDQSEPTAPVPSTMDATFTVYSAYSGYAKNISFNASTPATSIAICFNLPDGVFYADSIQQFHGDLTYFYPLFYYLQNQSISNTATVNISLYNINRTDSKLTEYLVLEGANQPVVNGYIQIMRYYPATNQILLMSMGKTDENGMTSSYVVPNDVNYQYIIIKNYSIYYTSNTAVLPCDPAATLCQHTILVDIGGNNPYQAFVGNTLVGCWVNTTTSIVYCTSSNPSGTGRDLTLNLWEMTTYGRTLACTNTIATGSGTVACAIPDPTKSYYYQGTSSIGSWIEIGSGMINGAAIAKFDTPTGLLGTALIVIIFAIVGMMAGLGTGILAATFGLAFAAMLGFFTIGIIPLSGIILVGFVIAFILRQ